MVWFLRGKADADKKRYEDAAAALGKALDLTPESPAHDATRGMIRLAIVLHEEVFERVADARPAMIKSGLPGSCA